jgi:hypothetical protein
VLARIQSTIIHFLTVTDLSSAEVAIHALALPAAEGVLADTMLTVAIIGHLTALIDVSITLEVSVPRGTLASVGHGTNIAAFSVDALGFATSAVIDVRALKTTLGLLDLGECLIFGSCDVTGLVGILVSVFTSALEGSGGVDTVGITVAVINVQLAFSNVNITVGVGPAILAVAAESVDTSVDAHTSRSPD